MHSPARGDRASRIRTPRGIACDRSDENLDAFRGDRHVAGGHRPEAILHPRNVSQIAKVLTWAADREVGVIPVSSEPPRRRGDTVPAREGSVMLDLSRMNRILHVDARDKIAVIEPGVRFGQVDKALAPHGLRAFRPLKPRAGKSLIASYLEREPLISPQHHWDTGDPFGGTGIVLGSGTYASTGGAASPGSLDEKLARGDRLMVPNGPTNLDLLRVIQGAQGSLGVMAWAAVYCEPIPEIEQARFAAASTLAPLVMLAREIMFRGMGNALFIVDRLQFALMAAADHAGFAALCARLPQWILFVRLGSGRAGAKQQFHADEKMAWQNHDLETCAASCGVRFETALAGCDANEFGRHLHISDTVEPGDRIFGDHRELFFLQQLNRADEFVGIVKNGLTRRLGNGLSVGVYLQPVMQGVSAHIEFTVPFAPERRDLGQELDDALFDTARACLDAGAFFSRPYHGWSSLAFVKDRGVGKMLAMTKSVLDPRGIMNPGRIPYGAVA